MKGVGEVVGWRGKVEIRERVGVKWVELGFGCGVDGMCDDGVCEGNLFLGVEECSRDRLEGLCGLLLWGCLCLFSGFVFCGGNFLDCKGDFLGVLVFL